MIALPERSARCGRMMRLVCVFGIVGIWCGDGLAAAEPALNALPGFQVTLFADDDLAHDIHCLTMNSQGQVTVAGNGYIRLLLDDDQDGRADRTHLFAEGPPIGVQGMYWHGNDLLAVGGDGLLRYRDQDGDLRADGPPEVLLRVKTGGEHLAHSIQKGPDGWWYLLAGNDTGVDAKFVTLATSPVKQPAAGVLYRMKPDIRGGGEVVAHGLRNSYDFAFNRTGDVFTYDSDDERDVSLPWYRPTRVFQLLPGSHAGWVTRSWKRPDDFLDMSPVVTAAGRGSPTGVVCYQHQQFPEKYREALFVLDWTFGRVIALPLARRGSSFSAKSELFLSAAGDHGFAPTDIEVSPDGSLFVSVGGRGTRGGVWRVSFPARQGATSRREPQLDGASVKDQLAACLTAPQPLSSWSRARWVPLAQQLGRTSFLEVVGQSELHPAARLRAIDILTELFGGIDPAEALSLRQAVPAEVRAKVIWSLGRTHSQSLDANAVRSFLMDDDPLVGRIALEALLQAESISDWTPLLEGIAKQLGSEDRFNRMAAARLVARLDKDQFAELSQRCTKLGWQATLMNAVGALPRSASSVQYGLKVAIAVLEGAHSADVKFQAVRLLQLSLGDMVPASNVVAAFEAYTSQRDLSAFERDLDTLRVRLAELFPVGDPRVDRELARALAMLSITNSKLLDKVLAQITEASDPVDDIHYLLVAARIPTQRNRPQAEAIGRALVNLEPKILARKMNQDLNWDDRVGELYRELAKLDPDLPDVLVAQPGFGRPGHVVFLSQLPSDLLPKVIDSYVNAVQADPAYPWSNEVVFVIGESAEPRHRELLRKQFEQFNVRGSVLVVLARQPEEQDRGKFIAGLDESRLEVLTACVEALGKLRPNAKNATEQFALLRALRRLGSDAKEFPIRDAVAKLLTRNHGRDFGFVFGAAGHRAQNEAIQRWSEFLAKAFPNEAQAAIGGDAETVAWLRDQMSAASWNSGDVGRGRALFEKRSCAQCHGGRRGLGPDLAGVTSRFSREDLFTAIALPSRDVSPRYQTTLIETKGGKVHTGLIIYESAEGVLLRNSTNQTLRIETSDVESRRTLPQSLMPTGLLKELQPADLADLFAYLRSLNSKASPTN